LPIGSGLAKVLRTLKRQIHSEAHQALIIRSMGELDLAHRLGQIAEEKGRSLLIVPDVRA